MIALASLIFAQVAVAPPVYPIAPLGYDSAEVVAERLMAIEATVGKDHPGAWQCALTATSGSDWADQRLCQVTARCAIRYNDEVEDIEPCIAKGRKTILREYRRALRGRA